MKEREFYGQEGPQRTAVQWDRFRSRELDFGVWWREQLLGDTFRVTWVASTGEVIAVRHRTNEYEVIGTITDETEVEQRLEGWAEQCGAEGSLAWVRRQVA